MDKVNTHYNTCHLTQVSIYIHDLGIGNSDVPLNLNDVASCLSKDFSIRVYLTSSPQQLTTTINNLSSHSQLVYGTTITCYFTKVAYSSAEPAPPHTSRFFIILFTHASCPFSSIWKPIADSETSPAPFPAPTCYLSHIPLPPVTREDSQAIPASLNILLESKVLLHSSFYHYLATSINLPPLTKEHIHTIYNAHLTYSMMLPTALTQSYWYLLPFAHKPLSHKYPAKDYTTLAMHFLAQSVDDAALKQITTFYNKLQHPLLTPYVYPTPTSTSCLTPRKFV